MAKTKISEFDVNPDNNTDINSINIAEGCAPSGINNAIRQLMSDLKDFQAGTSGDPFNGAVNGTVGATTPAAGTFTTVTANTSVSTDIVNEKTSGAGVTLDGVLLKDNAVSASNGFTQASTFNSASTMGFKNRIINGAMMIDQRNAGASVTVPNTNVTATWSVDRWRMLSTQASKFSVQQNAGAVTPPVGFTNYLGTTSLSAYSVISSDAFAVEQYIEGFNIADLGWGTANAQPVTLSFQVRSSLTGTFGGALRNSANNRSYPFTYTISAANTWEQKTITVAGDTSGTWLTNNGTGIALSFGIGVGSTFNGTAGSWAGGYFFSATGATSVVGTNGATFYITGVQLEKGSTATSFDYRPYGTELALCQRYCVVYGGEGTYERIGMADCVLTNTINAIIALPVQMRASPSVSVNSASNFAVYSRNTITAATTVSSSFVTSKVVNLDVAASGLTVGSAAQFITNNTGAARLTLSAEL